MLGSPLKNKNKKYVGRYSYIFFYYIRTLHYNAYVLIEAYLPDMLDTYTYIHVRSVFLLLNLFLTLYKKGFFISVSVETNK